MVLASSVLSSCHLVIHSSPFVPSVVVPAAPVVHHTCHHVHRTPMVVTREVDCYNVRTVTYRPTDSPHFNKHHHHCAPKHHHNRPHKVSRHRK
jgi:hypothetical protein